MTTIVKLDYRLAAGQELSAATEDVLIVTGSNWRQVLLEGRILVEAPAAPRNIVAVRVGADDTLGTPRTLTIAETGSITVNSTTPQMFVAAISAGGSFGRGIKMLNLGVIDVRSAGEAWGVSVATGGFENRGTLSVSAPRNATAVVMEPGGAFTNSGTITVSGGSAAFQGVTAVRIYNSEGPNPFVNSGVIRATRLDPAAGSLGVQIAGFTNMTNTGVIEGQMALALVRDFYASGGGRSHRIDNSGTLRGEVFLNNTAGEVITLRNSGRIEGTVTLNNSGDVYNGVGGVVTGVVSGDVGADSLIGGAGAETLQGGTGDDTIDGGADGADVLAGGDGLDVLSFAGSATPVTLDVAAGTASRGQYSGFERYVASNLDDTVRGSAGGDTLAGGLGADTVNGGLGGDSITDTGGANYLRGDEGDDHIAGGAAFDDINGNMGADTASGGPGGDWVVGGKDNDMLFGDAGEDLVYGNLGADTCEGGDGNDIVRGGQDNDAVRGGAGNDFLSGDRGDDTLTGGAGADTFHSFGEAGLDRVTDFNAAEGDRVQLAAGSEYTIAVVGFDTVINIVGGARMVLPGVEFPGLTASWILVG
jgi:Ca2+-binding RTX toxin-like protein